MGLTDKTTFGAYAASIGAVAGGMTVNEMVAIAGLALALATFVLNAVYKHLHYRLEKAARATLPPTPTPTPTLRGN